MVSSASASQKQVVDPGFPILGNDADCCAGGSPELLWPLGTRQIAKRFWTLAARRERDGVDSAPGTEINHYPSLERCRGRAHPRMAIDYGWRREPGSHQ